jgi:hypothetical protein
MIRRIAILCVALVAVMGATDAIAKKHKKKPKVLTGPYVGRTAPDGLDFAITLNGDRTTGTVSYCGMAAPFTAIGSVSFKTFEVHYVQPDTGDTIDASGFFSGKRRSVSGSIAPNGCTSVPQTFYLQR